ncbi:MAG: hypothetical protein ACOCRX_01490 [Candidatus Woesearchaeota archaeon]
MSKKIDINSEINPKIRLIGKKESVYGVELILKKNASFIKENNEKKIRKFIQEEIIHKHKFAQNIVILYEGNTIINDIKILRDIEKVKKRGMQAMTNNLYEFLHLTCGSIAHYNKQGWIAAYPTVESLKDFFKNNEFGERVLHHISNDNIDAIKTVEQIEDKLNIN